MLELIISKTLYEFTNIFWWVIGITFVAIAIKAAFSDPESESKGGGDSVLLLLMVLYACLPSKEELMNTVKHYEQLEQVRYNR